MSKNPKVTNIFTHKRIPKYNKYYNKMNQSHNFNFSSKQK